MRGRLSFHEYFGFVAKRLYALIGETTDDGIVFRVDLALRPNGNSGPPVVSLAMLEEYLQVQGREWERFAWSKSRVVAPRVAVTSGRALALRSLVSAFVYRRYLDYGVFEGLRQLHRKIRDEAQRRAAGRPERANDVKLSRGGIREIEFIVQLMLVVRGGQFPEIRTRSTLRGLDRLVARSLMKPEMAQKLAAGYVLLRRIEHRIQYLDDQQTHLLPTADEDLAWIARSLGLVCKPEACELLDRLCEVRELVAAEFDALLHDGQSNGARRRQRQLPPLRHGAAAHRQRGAARKDAARTGCAPAALGPAGARAGAARREPDAPGPVDAEDGAGRAGGRVHRSPRRCASSTGSSRCCDAKAISRCCSNAPRCTGACCACWASRAGPCST